MKHPGVTITVQLEPSPLLLAALHAIAASLTAAGSAKGEETAVMTVGRERGFSRKWITPDRDAVLIALWPTNTPRSEINRRIAALPGPPPQKSAFINDRAFTLGLKRHEAMISPKVRAMLAKRGSRGGHDAEPVAAIVATVPVAVAPAPKSPGIIAPRVAPAKPASAPLPAPDRRMDRQRADRSQITAFCNSRGWPVDQFDITLINARCFRVGHPGFELIDTRGRAVAG